MELKNCMEELVMERINSHITEVGTVCGCTQCKLDIAALALNKLPPRYVVTDKGETFTKIRSLEQQFTADVDVAIANAVQVVQSDPHHLKKSD